MGREVSAAAVASQSATCQLCVGIFRAGLRGDVRFRVSAGLAKVNKIGCSMNKQYEQIGLSVESTFWAPSLALF